VFEFAEPVGGPYPPLYDPSYWYAGIQPRFDMGQELKVLRPNLTTALVYFVLSPALPLTLLLLASGGAWLKLRGIAAKYYSVLLPVMAGTAMYCLVFVDKRYLAGFIVVIWLLLLIALDRPSERFQGWVQRAGWILCVVLFAGAVLSRFAGPAIAVAGDVAHGGERDLNFNWMMARRMAEVGLKPGDRIAFIGLAKDADWMRMLGCRTVAEVPIVYESGTGLLNSFVWNQKNIKAFLESDEAGRERVYEAFRKAGAVMVIGVPFPDSETAHGWKRVIGAAEPGIPKHDGQFQEQFPSYYRWLTPRRQE
jgi:hypothetical protein